jgi:hypothetical protein
MQRECGFAGESIMQNIVLQAHFDGRQIQLDDPFPLPPNTKLLVTILSASADDDERSDWLALSQENLARAYTEDEPDYSRDLIQEANPDYEGG